MPRKETQRGISRRSVLRTIGTATVVGLGASAALSGPVGANSQNSWEVTFLDAFDEPQLNTNRWGIGYGWGRTADGKREEVRDEDVWIDTQNNQLVLQVDHDGRDGWYSGAVNTKDKHAQQYGWWEASIKPPRDTEGLLPAWWIKPNNEDWPPEIDITEWIQSRDSCVHNVHWTKDEGDRGNEEFVYNSSDDLTADFHVYGCHWSPKGIAWYVDGDLVGKTSAGVGTGEGQLDYGQPFYAMLSCHIWDQPWLGSPDDLSGWPYEYRADWMRIWTRSDY